MRTAIKAVRQAADPSSAQEALQVAFSKIDKTAKHNVIHRNMAARYKSRLARFVEGMS
jgi:small subunit ribosomal protein S20